MEETETNRSKIKRMLETTVRVPTRGRLHLRVMFPESLLVLRAKYAQTE